MIVKPDMFTFLGNFELDHPEGVCVGSDGTVYAGGELGQFYRIQPDGSYEQFAKTKGFILGLALDGDGSLHACDCKTNCIWRVYPDGNVKKRSEGTDDVKMANPNYPVFDREGNLFVSNSGDYFNYDPGDGNIMVIRPDGATEMFHPGPFLFANGLAIDPDHTHLYIAQTTAFNVVRVPLNQANGPVEVVFQFPRHTLVDGLCFAADGRLLVSCYRPDKCFIGKTDGTTEEFVNDVTGELLNVPTNCALHDGKIYFANLGGWHISVMDTDMQPAPIYRPKLP
jgi:gluconolactonase